LIVDLSGASGRKRRKTYTSMRFAPDMLFSAVKAQGLNSLNSDEEIVSLSTNVIHKGVTIDESIFPYKTSLV
jgi:hypothetical protein